MSGGVGRKNLPRAKPVFDGPHSAPPKGFEWGRAFAQCGDKLSVIEPKLAIEPARSQLERLVEECAALRQGWPKNLRADATLTLDVIAADVQRLYANLKTIGKAASGPLFRALQAQDLYESDVLSVLERLGKVLAAAKRDAVLPLGRPANVADPLLAAGLRRILIERGFNVTASTSGLWWKCLKVTLPAIGSTTLPASVLRSLRNPTRKPAQHSGEK
jgi:hypothetical protein